MKKLLSGKHISFDMINVRKEESNSKNVKRTQDICGKPRNEKPWFKQELNVLALLSLVLCGKNGISCTIKVFFLKERLCFLPFYFPILSTFYYLLKKSTWVLTLKI